MWGQARVVGEGLVDGSLAFALLSLHDMGLRAQIKNTLARWPYVH